MRNEFADKYNLVTVQCNYLGWEFMQDANELNMNIDKKNLIDTFTRQEIDYIYKDNTFFQRLLEICGKHNINVSAKADLQESPDNFNEMGLYQAIDNVSAVIAVLEILKDNNYSIDKNKVLVFGQSHGAYLAYLANVMAPFLFTALIDNSAWLFPQYLKNSRFLHKQLMIQD